MGLIENTIADLENIKDKYKQNWVLPYGSAYVQAHDQFKATLASQAEWDKMKLDLFLTAATIGFGAGMGAMFGKTALSAITADAALTVVANRNMIRTFNAMAAVSSSVPGTFIAGQLWDTVGGKLSEAVKTKVTSMVTAAPASATAIQNPQIMQNDLEAYVLRIKTVTHDVLAFVRDSSAFNDGEKDMVANAVRNGPFFKNAPTRDTIGDRKRAADIMELSFYMVMVMDSDYLEEATSWQRGDREGNSTRNLGKVSKLTTDKTYGQTPAMKHSYGLGYANTTMTYVAYDKPGSKILDRINDLYIPLFGSEFFPNGLFDFDDYDRTEVQKAENAMTTLNTLVLSRPV